MGTADDTKRLRNTTMSSPPINSFVLPSAFLEQQSTLNPDAPCFVPPDWMVTDPNEIRRVEDVMKTFHHLASVNDTETLLAASEWLCVSPSRSADPWVLLCLVCSVLTRPAYTHVVSQRRRPKRVAPKRR